MRRMSANNHWGQEGANFHKQAGYMRAMISSHIDDLMSCKRSGSIYVGEGREQEAEASPARIAAGRRSYKKTFCNDWVNFIHNYRIKEFKYR